MPVTLALPDDLVAALRVRSETEGRPVEAVLADAVRRGLAALPSPQGATDDLPLPPWPTLPSRLGEPPVTNAFVRLLLAEAEREDDERAMGITRDDHADAAALSEEDVRRLEERIPELAAPAFAQAYRDALAAGSTVLIREGDALVEVSPDGTRRVLHSLPPLVPVRQPSPADAG